MRRSFCAFAIFSAVLCGPVQSVNARHTPVPSDATATENSKEDHPSNAEMRALFIADQAIRLEIEKRGGWAFVKDDKAFLERWAREDSERLKRTQELLELDALKAGIDFYHAAFIFQHSNKLEDFLKAHHLSVIAISKGYDARWISAATLDRYLQAIGKQQIYGTQYRANEFGEYVRQPVELGVVSDAERAQLNVPVLTDDK